MIGIISKWKAALCFLTLFPLHSVAQPEGPTLFLPGEISTEYSERDMAISPDGTEMFYTLLGNQNTFSVILHRKKNNKGWSTPEVASFSGNYGDLEPAFSADGKKLFFSSNRPITGTGVKDYDIWYVEKINGEWSGLKNIGSPVNTASNEFYPSVGSSGNLYFTAEYKTGVGKEDIFISEWKNGSYSNPIPLDTAVNSETWEFNAFVSRDENMIIFTSYGRKDDSGGGDLYMSTKDTQGKWTPAKNVTLINSNKLDYCPFVSFDRSILYFTSSRQSIPKPFEKKQTFKGITRLLKSPENGSENIYWISFKSVLEAVSKTK